jgi:hypothetical protein
MDDAVPEDAQEGYLRGQCPTKTSIVLKEVAYATSSLPFNVLRRFLLRGWKLSHGGTTAYLYVISQEVAKKRTRRTVKSQRAIVGASLDVIKERRAQRPEARAAARQAAIKEGKERKSAQESKKKQEKAKSAAGAARGQTRGGIASKQQAKGAPVKVTAKSR